jgi:hypothetical protein
VTYISGSLETESRLTLPQTYIVSHPLHAPASSLTSWPSASQRSSSFTIVWYNSGSQSAIRMESALQSFEGFTASGTGSSTADRNQLFKDGGDSDTPNNWRTFLGIKLTHSYQGVSFDSKGRFAIVFQGNLTQLIIISLP